MILKAIKYLAIFSIFIFPFVLFRDLAFPLAYSHVVFMFTVSGALLLLFMLRALQSGELVYKKSYITLALLGYVGVIVLTAITGLDFAQSFWSNYGRMSGIVTWLHYTAFFFVLAAVMTEKQDWKHIFRALSLSGLLLAAFSFLGVDGLNTDAFAYLKQGGSFLGNNSYSGAYMVLIFFFSFVGVSLESDKRWKIFYSISSALIFFNPDLFNFKIWTGEVGLLTALSNPFVLVGRARTSSMVLWFGAAITGLLWVIARLKNRKKVIGLFLALMIGTLTVYGYGFAALLSGNGPIYDVYIEQSGPVRPLVWDMAVEGIKDRPLLGYGDGNFRYVYQDHLVTEMVNLEKPPWFDRVHNALLEELVGHGFVGLIALIILFGCILWRSVQLFARGGAWYWLLVPFIFVFHFLQLQTFFYVDSSLFLTLVFLAFLVSHEQDRTLSVSPKTYWQIIAGSVCLVAFILFVVVPVRENRLIPRINTETNRSERLEIQPKLQGLWIDPVETLRQTASKFSDDSVKQVVEIQKQGLISNTAEEYQSYIDAYEWYVPKYKNYHRFLAEYANLINIAYIFSVDELARGEELSRQSLAISDRYPYPYWTLAINLYYQGRFDEALDVARRGYELDPTIKKSEFVYETIKKHVQEDNGRKNVIYIADFGFL